MDVKSCRRDFCKKNSFMKWLATLFSTLFRQNYLHKVFVFGLLCPSSGIVKNTPFRKLELFSSSGEGVADTHSVVKGKGKVVPVLN
jgi:hypothetical protein